MKITKNNDDTKNKVLEYQESFWTGKRIIRYDGVELKKVNRNLYCSEQVDEKIEVKVKGNSFSGLSLIIFGREIKLIRNLAWYEILLSVLVPIPCLFFGLVGGAIGGGFAVINLYMLRRFDNIWIKIIVSLGIMILAGCLSYLLALSLLKLINPAI